MIDKIKLTKRNITEKEFRAITAKTALSKNTKNEKIYYDNATNKNFSGGFFIQIDEKKTLKVTGSVHKYINFLVFKKLDNYNNITMQTAKEGIIRMLESYGLDSLDKNEVEVQYFEVGVNKETEEPTHKILEEYQSIKNKKLYFHPRFKNETLKTTETDKDKKRIFRIYDKVQEMKDNKREIPESIKHLTRYETVYRKQKITLNRFLTDEYLAKLKEKFYNEANQIKGFFKVRYKGSGRVSQLKIEIATNILMYGIEKTLQKYKEEHSYGGITSMQLHTRKKFLKEWVEKRLFYEYEKY